MQQQETASQLEVPALRQRLTKPETWLGLFVVGIVLAMADAQRDPDRQVLSVAYLAGVRAYQQVGHPFLEGRVQCRFRPTCSEYSALAVTKYGIGRGLRLTASRIWSCRGEVPLGTYQGVP
jgi:hypothetical protein